MFFCCYTKPSSPRDAAGRHETNHRGQPLDNEGPCWAWRQRYYHGKIKDGGQIDLINLSLLRIDSIPLTTNILWLLFSRHASQKAAGMPQPTFLEVVGGVARWGEAKKLEAAVHLREGKRNKPQRCHKGQIYVLCIYVKETSLIKREQRSTSYYYHSIFYKYNLIKTKQTN